MNAVLCERVYTPIKIRKVGKQFYLGLTPYSSISAMILSLETYWQPLLIQLKYILDLLCKSFRFFAKCCINENVRQLLTYSSHLFPCDFQLCQNLQPSFKTQWTCLKRMWSNRWCHIDYNFSTGDIWVTSSHMITMCDFVALDTKTTVYQLAEKKPKHSLDLFYNYKNLLKSLGILLGNLFFWLCIHSPKQESKASKFAYKFIRAVQTFSRSPHHKN